MTRRGIIIVGSISFSVAALLYLGAKWFFADPLAGISVTPATVKQSDRVLNTEAEIQYLAPQDHHLYVGSESCRECHAEICDSYSEMDMWHSFSENTLLHPAEESFNVGDVTLGQKADQAGQLQYLVRYKVEGQQHVERLRTEDDKTIYEIEHPVKYVVGSGARGYSYLIEKDGNLFQSPLTWYSEPQKWGLSPGFEKRNHRFTKRITDDCVSCHVGRVKEDPNRRHHYLTPIVLEAGISCERCHGPAAKHIEFHHLEDISGKDDPIVNPRDLPAQERAAVCYQCHASPDDRVLRAGRSPFDFRPGDPLSRIWISFSRGTGVGRDFKTNVVNHVEQMQSSQCFQASTRWFGCTSCHDPHKNPPAGRETAYYRNRCLECHENNQSIDCSLQEEMRLALNPHDACTECHMPKLAASDVAHTSQTDHRILKNPFQENRSSAPLPTEAKLSSMLNGNLTEFAQTRAKILLEYSEILAKDDQFKANSLQANLELLLDTGPADRDLLYALGALQLLQGRTSAAEKSFQNVLKYDPHSEMALHELLKMFHSQKRYQAALEIADHLLKLNPTLSDVWGRKAHMLGQLGKVEEGIIAARKAVEIDPSIVHVHHWLANAYRVTNDSEKSAQHSEIAEKLTPKK